MNVATERRAARAERRPSTVECDFDRLFTELFEREFPRVFRYLDRLDGDPDVASDLAQEAFVRLYRRGSLPDDPAAWVATVALNLFRNERSKRSRRRRLLTVGRARRAHSDPARGASADAEERDRAATVRAALGRLRERERQLLVLSAEGYRYREIADILGIAEGSVGTLLARARASLAKEVGHAT